MKNTGYEKYYEKKQHGSSSFPMELYLVDYTYYQYVMPLHWHKELELVKIISGTLDLYINNVLYPLSAGDIAVINCNYLHRGDPHNCRYEVIVFDLEFMVKKSNEIYSDYIYPIIAGDLIIHSSFHREDSRVYEELSALFAALKGESSYYRLGVLSSLFTLLEQLYTDNYIYENTLSKKSPSRTQMIFDLLKWIEENFTEHISLDLLAQNAGVTPNYLCRIFKSYTGKTPIEYINFIRIQNICHEMKEGKKNITEAASDNGFNDISYFCKVFKKQMGVSAKRYLEITMDSQQG